MIVAKFGGSSLATADNFKAVTDIIREDAARKVIVCSAPGKRFTGDSKITDLLLYLAANYLTPRLRLKIQAEIEERFKAILKGLGLKISDLFSSDDYESYFQQDFSLLSPENRSDLLIPLGEVFSAATLAAYLSKQGYKAKFCDAGKLGLSVYWSEDAYHVHGDSLVKLRTHISKLLADHDLLVVPGFYGFDLQGCRRPLSRGGSDVTASWLAAATNSTCEIWSDVSGVYEADPNIIQEAWKIDYLSYAEMLAMARFGAQILHPEAIKPMLDAGQIMYVKNSFRPQDIGTEINSYNLAKRVAPLAVSLKHTSITTLLAINGEGIEERRDLAKKGVELLRTLDPKAQLIDEMKIPACLLFSISDEFALKAYKSLWYHFIELSGWTINADYDLELRQSQISLTDNFPDK
ncbi:MAG: hypothetical protein Q4E09_01695 [Eubacteriales bacterium]|nr:hypothetical protein [Eubacteriales bacterium]